MPNINSNISAAPFKCRDVIGVRGVCETTYPYYLDTLGISLSKASDLADSSKVTGRQLIDDAIEMAWQDVFSDLRADGFMVNGVQRTHETFFNTTQTKGEGTYTLSLYKSCDIEQTFIGKLIVSVSGELNVVLTATLDGVTQTVYSGDLEDEDLTVTFDNFYNAENIDFTLVATGDGEMKATDDGGVMKIDSYTMCSERLFYCKYWSYLVRAVMYKTVAHILNASLFSDRYNDLITYKKDEIAVRISQLDSSMNLLGTVERINTKGMYQKEIENINLKLKQIVKNSYCTCCFECDNVISSSIAIP